jgi:hypothetical protein
MLALAIAFTTGSALAQPTQLAQPTTFPPAVSDKARTPSVVALRVQLTVTRSEGDKRLATVPLTLTVLTSGEPGRLNMGAESPIPAPAPGQSVGTVDPAGFNYRQTGTAVTATASRRDAGYQLTLLIDSTWVNETSGKQGLPQFGSFRAEQSLTLTDGQTVQFTSAADPASQQTVKVEVSISRQP